MEKIKCKYPGCKNMFIPKRSWHKYCSATCRKKAWDDLHGVGNIAEIEKRLDKLEEIVLED